MKRWNDPTAYIRHHGPLSRVHAFLGVVSLRLTPQALLVAWTAQHRVRLTPRSGAPLTLMK